ncbi:MAG: hypothetical protein IKK92_06065 [Prevotella sp.]|nr:hypothetical protein [Prevotella sp.]
MKKILLTIISLLTLVANAQTGNTLEQDFIEPKDEHRSIIIWQWMDGLVNKEGITADLEAFKAAGLSGVQNFQIGGPHQIRVNDPSVSIGSEKWKGLMRWAMDECERLGLTFGTHNCPGWSSSAYPTVEPQYSMLKLVYSEMVLPTGKLPKKISLKKPEVDSTWNYYEDVAVIAIPNDSIIKKEDVVFLSDCLNKETDELTLPKDLAEGMAVLRIGQTTIGKTNASQSPESGKGLECDKLSREAVLKFWQGYPQMIIDIAGRHAGKTFTHFEIDSYEAGGQTWTGKLPEEFKKQRGYDLMPYMPYMIGRCKTIGDKQETAKFKKDWQTVIQTMFAENYYGYMNELARQTPGLNLLIEPYGTGGQRPFSVIDFYKIVGAAKEAVVATEFWTYPNWGWKDMAKHEVAMRKLQRKILYAEAFTCWPLKAWQDDPQSLKAVCDRAYCTGVNKMMLHAGAANPWTNFEPGMSFGIWGTQFVPKQTWWKAGGAKKLFDYMARCQSLLQRGYPAKEQMKALKTFKTYRRTDGDTDIYFICNPTDKASTETLQLVINGRSAEIWNPYTLDMNSCEAKEDMALEIEPYGSRFIILRHGTSSKPAPKHFYAIESMPVTGTWNITFPEYANITMDSLVSWTDNDNNDIKYFSGTATYSIDINIKKKQLKDKETRFVLSLGKVKNMARVTVNGYDCGLLWKAPFTCDITDALLKGNNSIAIGITNLWPNRMIGDELEPADIEWGEALTYSYAPGSPTAGYYMAKLPDWLREGKPRPSKGRKTVYAFKFFTKDSPLLESGLFGPVEIMKVKRKE